MTLSAYVAAAHTEGLKKHLHIRGLGQVIDRGTVLPLGVMWPQLCGLLLLPAAIACYLLQQLTGGKPSLYSLSAIVAARFADEHVA